MVARTWVLGAEVGKNLSFLTASMIRSKPKAIPTAGV